MTVDTRAADLFVRTPINSFLNSRLVHRCAERVEVRAAVSAAQAQEYGIVQGGIVSAIADTAAVYLLIPEAMDRGTVSGVEFKMNFLRPVRADGGELAAVAKPLKIGRRLAVCAVDVTQDERHVASGVFTYLVGA
ncbi:MAG: PaaI family thioesterase [Candidatus Krumholzibacteria bacterium]|nr:PaaI family thioesterase [Candidatus Krumholzibacteria bacterium]MDH4336233.1 PaaI family thioesterase [Candidatus Krumholzibacteria bacterium]MDH5268874.1 PaaI family thioesterase [Candidatus Krumholzibacteria bacterium]MDH5628101.1 PaaI family thioesterase [Candidatus Krumholzibacteria bacterium]